MAAIARCLALLYITTNWIAAKAHTASATGMPWFEILSFCFCEHFLYFLLHNIYVTVYVVIEELLTRPHCN